jgi:hypothetical protein
MLKKPKAIKEKMLFKSKVIYHYPSPCITFAIKCVMKFQHMIDFHKIL